MPSKTRRHARTVAQQRDDAQTNALALALDAIDQGRQPRILAALEGPYAPLRRGTEPYWAPPLPGATWAAYVPAGYQWARPYEGRAVTLDRSGAWITAASSVTVAHGALDHTGETEFSGAPGYYKIIRHPWHEGDRMPDPLGGIRTDEVWVPHPIVALLRDLAEQGRWADVAILDSWTGEPARLREWASFANALRDHAIAQHGRGDAYDAVKTAFAQAVSLMLGYIDEKNGHRAWKCRARRPDWRHAIQAQAVASQWRWADDLRRTCPQHPPVALRNVDEIVLPADALPIVTTHDRPGGRKPLQLDPLGVALGTFKVKGEEDWTNG